jgi:NADH dehydrogenase
MPSRAERDPKQDRAGRILVNDDCTIPGHPEIYVTADVMSLNKLPGVAEVAMQSGLHAGNRFRHAVAGDSAAKPFHYRDPGSAAYISRGKAVVSVGRLAPAPSGTELPGTTSAAPSITEPSSRLS